MIILQNFNKVHNQILIKFSEGWNRKW